VEKRRRTDESLRFVLNVCKYYDDVTSDGRLFQVLPAATANAQSTIVEIRVSGTASDLRSMTSAGVVDQEAVAVLGRTGGA